MKCTRQFAPIAAKSVKFPSNLTQAGLFTVVSAGLRGDHKGLRGDLTEDTENDFLRIEFDSKKSTVSFYFFSSNV